MKRTLFIIAFTLASVLTASAQDRIYFNDSRIVNAVVDQVGSRTIRYRLYSNPDGPVRSASSYDVAKIVFESGEVRTFSDRPYYDEGFLFEERARALLGDQPLKMRFDSGHLYLGSRSRYGARQADYVAFNLYGDEYDAARRNHRWAYGFMWVGTMVAAPGVGVMLLEGFTGGGALLAGAGAACLGVGISYLCKGNNILKGIAKDYNSRMETESRSPELTFGACPNGVGFALNF